MRSCWHAPGRLGDADGMSDFVGTWFFLASLFPRLRLARRATGVIVHNVDTSR